MSELETNIFRITNLRELASTYRTYRVINLHGDQEEYHQNCQALTRKLSYTLRSAAVVIDRKGEAILVVKQDAPPPPKELVVFRTQVLFEPLDENIRLDYAARSPENDIIALRFLSFLVQTPLRGRPGLWQPGSGKAFFERQPCRHGEHLNQYHGYSVRPVLTSTGDIGLCVDVHSKLVYRRSLPPRLDRQGFQRCRGVHCIYHFGMEWYEIALAEYSALNVSQYKFPENGHSVTLYDYILEKCPKPLPEEIDHLPRDSSTVIYSDNREERKGAATALCYQIAGNDDLRAQEEFPSLSIPPAVRRQLIHAFVEGHLRRLRFGDTELRLDARAMGTPPKLFQVPDLEFGCGRVLSTRGTHGAVQVSLDQLGRARMSMLKDKSIGFYVSTPLDNFYFFMPQSVHETFGPVFLQSLCAAVDDLFPQATLFEPRLVVYPDRGKGFSELCEALFDTASAHCERGGYAVAMIPENQRRRPRAEDTSAAFVIQQLKARSDIVASVIHTTVGKQSYVARSDAQGRTVYSPHPRSVGRLNGYLRNVAINKILLLNQKWPFVLATPLHADAAVGIDVKGNMAGFVATNKRGDTILPFHKKSQQKEKLMPKQCKDYFYEIIRRLAEQGDAFIKNIAVHRDGQLYDTEIRGIKLALEELKANGLVAAQAEVTFLEIPKTAPAPLRLFAVSTQANGACRVDNPQVGNYYVLSQSQGFVCTTGRAFGHRGTAKPLHVIKREGPLSIEQCLEDILSLSSLAWTRPEDCSRDPVTVKLNDRWLGEDGPDIEEQDEEEAAGVAEEVEGT